MIAFCIYLLIILWLISFNGFFGIFDDAAISRKQFSLLFFLKALAVPVFYGVYKKLYGGIEGLDAGKFYHDIEVIATIGRDDLPSYLKILFGLQDDTPGGYEYLRSHSTTWNWDNGTTKDYLYNDNRVLIRVFSVLYFISFGSYFVLALFSCFFSFLGITFVYRAFKDYYARKELAMLIVCCFLPALWFYTGGLLKEGITVFTLGSSAYLVKKIIGRQVRFKELIFFVFLVFVSLFLKPYLLLFVLLCFSLLFFISSVQKIRLKILVFLGAIGLGFMAANTISLLIKKRSLASAALKHQRTFTAVAKGGIYLTNASRYLRLNYDTSLVTKVVGKKNVYRIAKNAVFDYWQNNRPDDTLRCKSNKDTLSEYLLVYMTPEGSSNVLLVQDKGILASVLSCLYYSVLYPFFFNAHGFMQMLASLENLALVISLIVVVTGLIRRKKPSLLPFVLTFVCLTECVLVALANPNSGAIFRYRAPVAIFVFLGALYYLNDNKSTRQKAES